MTIGNLNNVMRNKQRELQPKRKRIGRFGTHTVNVKRHTVGAYEL